MKKKLQIAACSMFLAAIPLSICFSLADDSFSLTSSQLRAGNSYTLTLNSTNKYLSGDQVAIATDNGNGSYVEFQYSNVSTSSAGHVVIENGAMNNKVNPATYMFTAANYYDMKNTQSVEIGRSSAEKDLAASRESINALKALLERERAGTTSEGAVEAEFVEKSGE